MIFLYRQPKPNEQFVIGSDPSEGGDNSTVIALSKQNAEVVLISKSKEESSQLGYSLNHIGKWFFNKTSIYPSIGVERNMGAATIYVLKELNYPNLFRMPGSFVKDSDATGESYGWHTNSATRPKMLDDLALALRQRAIRISSKILVDELYSFVRNQKTGKPQADRNSHDDLVMALAIAWQMYQITPSEAINDDLIDVEFLWKSEQERIKNL
jgi:hypothetical protein